MPGHVCTTNGGQYIRIKKQIVFISGLVQEVFGDSQGAFFKKPLERGAGQSPVSVPPRGAGRSPASVPDGAWGGAPHKHKRGLRPFLYAPPGRVPAFRNPALCKAVSYPLFFCSQRPAPRVETSQSRREEGGLQTLRNLFRTPLFCCGS